MQLDPNHKLSPTQNSYIESVLTGGSHLLQLVNEILDLARIEANQIELIFETVNLDEIVPDCVTLADALAEAREISIIDEVSAKSLKPVTADRTRFKQILLNLLSNVVKYNTDGGMVTITAKEGGDGYLRLSVADTGVGIAKEDCPGVFEMYHRLGADATVAREGTGIGLTVSKQLTEHMAGRIGFESALGIGSTFWVEMPLAPDDASQI